MKLLLAHFFLLLGSLCSLALQAQTFTGSWRGTLSPPQNPSASALGTISLRVSGTQAKGELILQANNVQDKYVLACTIQGNKALGTATYPTDGTVFQFEGILNKDQLIVAVGQNDVPTMAGVMTRVDGLPGTVAVPNQATSVPRSNVPADGLARNPRLAGTWANTSYYGSGTDFSSSTRTTLIFFTDGRLGSGGASVNASYSGSAGSSNGSSSGGSVQVAEGAKWYTKGDQIWLRATSGQQSDELFGKFSLSENGRQMLLYRGSGKKIYERVD